MWRMSHQAIVNLGNVNLYLTRSHVRRALGEALVVRIDPRSVDYHVGNNQPLTHPARLALNACGQRYPWLRPATRRLKKLFYSMEPFLLRQATFDSTIPIEREERYILLADFIEHRDCLEHSLWFRKLRQSLEDDGRAVHKSIELRSDAEILSFLNNYVHDLVGSLERTGYDAARASDTATAFVDSNGAIHKSDAGNHRFAAARIVGAVGFPLKILGVHRDWYRCNVGNGGMAGLREALRKVEAAHCGDRGSAVPRPLPAQSAQSAHGG